MPLLRTKSSKKEAEISLEATKDGCTPTAKAMVLPRSPDEALVVDIARGLNGCDVVKQANGVLVKTASCVGNHGEEGDDDDDVYHPRGRRNLCRFSIQRSQEFNSLMARTHQRTQSDITLTYATHWG